MQRITARILSATVPVLLFAGLFAVQDRLTGQNFSPASFTVGSDGGVVASALSASAPWNASANTPFLRIAGAASGVGSANLLITADRNSAATSRTGSVNAGGAALSITQLPKYMAGKGLAALTANANLTTVGVSRTGRVYFGDASNASVKYWDPVTRQVSTYYTAGASFMGLPPLAGGITEDSAGNLYFTDVNNNRLLKNGAVLAAGGLLNKPQGLAVAGDIVYIANTGGGNVLAYSLTTQAWSVVGSGFSQPAAVAVVPGSAEVYVADPGAQFIYRISNGLTSQVVRTIGGTTGPSGFPAIPRQGLAADADGNLYYVTGNTTQTLFKWDTATSAQSSLGSVTGVKALSVDSDGDLYLASSTAIQKVNTGNPNASLGNTFLMAGSAGGSQSAGVDFRPGNFSAPWSVSSSSSWLQVTNPSGTGPATLLFTVAANPGAAPRTGQIVMDSGLVLVVTQAGTSHNAVATVNTLVPSITAYGVAVDGAGNVVVANGASNSVQQVAAAAQTVSTLQTGLSNPTGVAVDSLGTLFIADTNSNSIKRRTISGLSTVVSSGLAGPSGVAVDASGNLYIADTNNNALKMWTASSNSMSTLAAGLNAPNGVAADDSGNVYIADRLSHTIKYWNAATRQLSTLVGSGLTSPYGVAVDGYRNLAIADSTAALKIWKAATQQLSTAGALAGGYGTALDGQGNAYGAPGGSSLVKLTHAYLDTTSVTIGQAAGSDALPVVLPPATPLTGVLAPTSDQAWLTISGVTNGQVSYSYLANTTNAPRTAHIRILGQDTTVTQFAYSMTATAGSTPQAATANTGFAVALGVTVRNGAGLPVAGASVTFTAPATGVTGLLNGALATYTVATNASGVASVPITAGSLPGTYVVTAATANAKTIGFVLSNTAGTPATVLPNAGATPQTTGVLTLFANALGVTVRDAGGWPLGGVSVTFTAPSTGASGTFQNGTRSQTLVSNSSGVAALSFTANGTAGTYTVTATAGALPAVNLTLTNTPVATMMVPSSLSTPQSAPVNATFAGPLRVTLQDNARNLVGGVSVTFTAPDGAGVFSNGLTAITVVSNGAGVASVAFIAGSTPRAPYRVMATAGPLSANFDLYNYGAPVTMTANGRSTQSVKTGVAFSPLAVTVRDSVGNGIPGKSVTFLAPATNPTGTFGGAQSAVVTTTAAGVASAPLFTGTTAGTYTVTASSTGLPNVTFALTNGTPTSMLATSPNPVTVPVTSIATFSVQVRDQYGIGLRGVSVTFTTVAGTFQNSGNSSVTLTTDADGGGRATLLPRIVGTSTVSAASSGLTTVRFTVTVQ